MNRLLFVFAMFIVPTVATAGTVYKCTTKDGKVEYSQTPCEAGKVEAAKIQTDPTSAREEAQAKARLKNYQNELQQRKAAELAKENAPARAAQSASVQRNAQESAKQQAQQDNEKQLVHTNTGWERLTKAQIADRERRLTAEAKASEAKANAAARAASGDASVNQQQRQVLLNGVPMIPSGGGYIAPQTGTFYIDAGGGIINSQTGQFIPK